MRAPRYPAIDVLHEDDDIVVINKPPGLLTSTVPHEKRPTAIAFLRDRAGKENPRARVGVIHRLDRDASGLLVFSKNPGAYRALKEQFVKHSVKRIYMAVVEGELDPREGIIKTRLVEHVDGTVHSTGRGDSGEEAITHYKTIRTDHLISLLRVTLETGKKHQIRAHLSERGHPVLNDPMYAKGKPTGQLMLCAVELHLNHPRTKKRMRFQIQLPRRMAEKLRQQ